jgi:short-subunit dehydrogenase
MLPPVSGYGTTAKHWSISYKGGTYSAAGLVPTPMQVPYAATKHAVVGLSTSLRAEAAELGVKLSVVCPGFIRTEIFDTAVKVTNYKDKDAEADFLSAF